MASHRHSRRCCPYWTTARIPIHRGAAVVSPNEFWLYLHRLAEAYDAEGLTTEERSQNIIAQLEEMPHVAQRQLLADLMTVAVRVPDIYPLAVAAVNAAEERKPFSQKTEVA